jgi:hypothetical protein
MSWFGYSKKKSATPRSFAQNSSIDRYSRGICDQPTTAMNQSWDACVDDDAAGHLGNGIGASSSVLLGPFPRSSLNVVEGTDHATVTLPGPEPVRVLGFLVAAPKHDLDILKLAKPPTCGSRSCPCPCYRSL